MCVLGFLYIAVINIFAASTCNYLHFQKKLPAIRYHDLVIVPNFMYHGKVNRYSKHSFLTLLIKKKVL